jgi:cytochrome c553
MKRVVFLIAFLTPLVWGTNLNSCTGCHGTDFQKKALGKSKVVKDMTKEEIISTMKGYRDGTYGGPLKSVMVRAVKSLSDKDIEEIANKIKK